MVSFPPLIDMLKFSGYPYLIRGQPCKNGLLDGQPLKALQSEVCATTLGDRTTAANCISGESAAGQTPNTKQGLRVEMTLEQACPPEYQGAQCAFKDSMIH